MTGPPDGLAPLYLTWAARDAYTEAHQLARLQPDPDMPLAGYLQPLRDLRHAIICAAGTAARIAAMAQPAIGDLDASAGTRKALDESDALACRAADHLGTALDEIRRTLRQAGQSLPWLDGTPRVRAARATAGALERLSAESGRAQAIRPAMELEFLKDPAFWLAVTLDRLGQSGDRLRTGIGHAYTQAAGLPRRAAWATGPVIDASQALMKASGLTHQAVGIIGDDLKRQRLQRRRAAS